LNDASVCVFQAQNFLFTPVMPAYSVNLSLFLIRALPVCCKS